MKIEITCKVMEYETLERLKDFQGDLKTIDRVELEKVKASILKYGFSFPVFTWKENILDGHQRIAATKELIKAGHTIDAIPIVRIDADDKRQAAEKLLLINSRYAEIDQSGFENFVADFDIDLPEIEPLINITGPYIDEVIDFEGDDKAGASPWERIDKKQNEKIAFSFGEIFCNVEKEVYQDFLEKVKDKKINDAVHKMIKSL